jgi:hypothetical protein
MLHGWKERLTCANQCSNCQKAIGPREPRILSVYNDEALCMTCKKKEEQRPDYQEASEAMVRLCMLDTEKLHGDPGGYCFHHFYPYTCH